MTVSDDGLALEVQRIFSANTRYGNGPLDSRTLYRLWQSTGLRRSDLTTGIRALMDAGCLRAEQRSGICRYQLVRRHRRADCDGETPPLPLPKEERQGGSSSSDPQLPSATSVNFDRRREDHHEPGPSGERRRLPRNRLLNALPAREREELKLQLELAPMPAGHILWKKGEQVRYFYFPVDCVLSISHELSNGSSSEVATIGNEGMIDVTVLLGDDTAARRALVSLPGYAYRLPVDALRLAFGASGAVHHELLHYMHALFLQTAQLIACGKHHSVEQQLCRMLLSSMDRMRSRTLSATQETLAGMLGVRREGITEALGRLKHVGLISVERGSLVVLDREGLEARVCECYATIRNEYDYSRPGPRRATTSKPVTAVKDRRTPGSAA